MDKPWAAECTVEEPLARVLIETQFSTLFPVPLPTDTTSQIPISSEKDRSLSDFLSLID